MFAVYEVDYIEDYHQTWHFVAAAHSRETLENYVAEKERVHAILLAVLSKYREYLGVLLTENPFLMEYPPRYCSNRNAKTATEHKQNKEMKDVWLAQVREVEAAAQELTSRLRGQARAQAFESLGVQDDKSMNLDAFRFRAPEYRISDIVVLD